MKHLFPIVASVLCAQIAFAGGLELASPFTDGLVLQRERPVPVWGTAEPGRSVTVSFGGQTLMTTASTSGAWRVDLAPLAASKESRELVVEAEKRVTVKDVLVGEVWIVSGQSNAEFPLVGPNPRFRDRQGALVAQMTYRDSIRFAWSNGGPFAEKPQAKTPNRVEWKRFTPKNLSEGRSFSALGVYFALELYGALDIPIGLIGPYWGGTAIDPWIPDEGWASRPDLEDIRTRPFVSQKDWTNAHKEGVYNGPHQQPRVIWNARVAPWTPFAVRGVVWYQGESNLVDGPRYTAKMHAFYAGWSKKFENPDLKFYYAQVAPWGDNRIAVLQQAQAQYELEEPHAAMAVINDLGNLRDIHPNEKELVAKRLAVHALRRDYGFTDIQDNSPRLRSWKVENGRFKLGFDFVRNWYVYNPDRAMTVGFEVAGADGKWHPAELGNIYKDGSGNPDGKIIGTELEVFSRDVPEPEKLRYLHQRPWFGALYNDVNLPLGAFEIATSAN